MRIDFTTFFRDFIERPLPQYEFLSPQTIVVVNFTLPEDPTMEKLAAALTSGRCPRNLSLTIVPDVYQCLKNLQRALSSGRCPENLTIQYINGELDSGHAPFFLEPLTTGSCPKSLHLDLSGNHFKGIDFLGPLTSGKCPQNLKLTIRNNSFNDADEKALADALSSGKCPEGLTLDLGESNLHSFPATKYFTDALSSGHCPKNLTLDFSDNCVNETWILALADSLSSGRCPNGLTIGLRRLGNFCRCHGYAWCHCSAESTVWPSSLARALTSGKCPQDFTLDFSENLLISKQKEKQKFANEFAIGLAQGKCPIGMSLILQIGLSEPIVRAIEPLPIPILAKLRIKKLQVTLNDAQSQINKKLAMAGEYNLLSDPSARPIIDERDWRPRHEFMESIERHELLRKVNSDLEMHHRVDLMRTEEIQRHHIMQQSRLNYATLPRRRLEKLERYMIASTEAVERQELLQQPFASFEAHQRVNLMRAEERERQQIEHKRSFDFTLVPFYQHAGQHRREIQRAEFMERHAMSKAYVDATEAMQYSRLAHDRDRSAHRSLDLQTQRQRRLAEHILGQPNCPVCLEPFDTNQNRRLAIIPCSHLICSHCIAQLPRTAEGPRCPHCRGVINGTENA